MLLMLASCALGMVLLIHITDFQVFTGQGTRFAQGRYLLPGVSLAGLCVAFLVSRLPRRVNGAAGGAVLMLLLGGQVISLAAVISAFYL